MKKRLLSILLVIMMIITSMPINSFAVDLPGDYTAEQILEQGNKFYNIKKNDPSWSPASLTAFAIKAAGLGEVVIPDENSYDYFSGIHKRRNSSTDFSILGLIDKIWDQLAAEKDDSEIRPNIIELLSIQRSDGTFSNNAFEHAQAVLVLDAYYGLDYDEDWIERRQGEGYGRISAVKALTNIEGNILWNKSDTSYKGKFLSLTNMLPTVNPNGFTAGSSTEPLYAYPLIALSSYMKHPDIGQSVTDTVSICLAKIESRYHKEELEQHVLNIADLIYLVPAIISLDNTEINPVYCSRLAGKAMNDDNNKVDALSLIEDYKFIPFFDKYDDYKDDGGFRLSAGSSSELTEFFTQKAAISASDILAGETAYKRIKGVRAIALDKLKEAIDSINIPLYVEVNPESIQAGNNTAHIDLPSQGINGTSITWTSSNPEVIGNNGTVIFSEKVSEKVVLTAEVSLEYDNGKILSKTRDFEVEIQSMVVGEAGQLLGERFDYIDETYGKDISSLGWEGVIALGETGIDLSGYTFGVLSDGNSAEDCAKDIIQIVIMGRNPYDYNGIDYVDRLKKLEDDYSGSPIVLIALEAVGEKPENELISAIISKTVTSTSISAYSIAVNAISLADIDNIKATSSSAIMMGSATTGTAASFREISENYMEFVRAAQNGEGMFGESLEDHAEAVSVLTALGEDMFTPEYMKEGHTILNPVKNSSVSDLSSLKILANIVARENLWHRIQVTEDKLLALVNRAEAIVSAGEGKYSPKTLQKLKDTLKDVGSGISELGKDYYELKSAIDCLSTDFLPEFTDLKGYTEESTAKFISAADELYKFLKTGKSSVSRAKEYASKVMDAYNTLELIGGAASGKIVNMLPKSYAGNYSNHELLTLSKNIESEPYIAEAMRILEKTSRAYDERYGYDVSSKGYWGVFEVCAMGKDISTYRVYDVTNHKKGLLSTYQATDFAAIILQLVMTGENPYDYKGINYVDWLLREEQVEKGEGNGNFGPYANNIWSLMALGAVGEYNEKLVKTVTSMAKKGEWVDTEAWALAAIQNYRNEVSEDDMALIINNFHDKMLSASNVSDNWSIGNAFTHGCVISGLVAAGEDITSEKWTSKGLNILTSMERAFQTEDGKFIIGDNFEPDFVKDAIIALGDASQGSNVWQRTYLDNEKLEAAITKGEAAFNNASEDVPEYKKAALRLALEAANGINNVRGNGHIYFRLIEAIKDLNEVELPEFAEKSIYTTDSFLQFENALKGAALILMQTEARAYDLNNSCIKILNTYDGLKETGTNPGGPGDGDKITVTFRLLGAEKHGGSGTIQTLRKGNLKTWISKSRVEINKGSKVYDVFTKVLDENGYDYIGAEDNYVSRIITPDGLSLGEFDNGQPSGWMYTVNGKHPNVGLRAYTLSDGDDIIWHYTDDYTQEEGSEKWNNSISVSKTDSFGVTTEIESKKDKDGIAVAKLTLEEAKAFAQALGKIENKNGMSANMKIKLPEGAKGLKTEISEEIMKALKDKDNISLKISSDMWGMTVDAKALKSIIGQYGTKRLEISFVEEKLENLAEETKKLVGDRKIYNISVYSNGKYISSFEKGEINCYIPYDAKNEDVYKLSVYRVMKEGNFEKIEKSRYDGKSKLFSFTVNSLSYFAVGYDKSIKISFGDVLEGHWAYEHIMKLAEKGILNGRSENIFAPEDSITRAEFVAILAKLSGDDLSEYSETVFYDIKNDDWFAVYAAWANEKGVAMGNDSKFNPNIQISRQDMAVMLVRYIKYIEKELTKEHAGFVFTDDVEISGYAREAVYYMTEGGIISGRGNNVFAPAATATRSEAAKMINTMLEGLELK